MADVNTTNYAFVKPEVGGSQDTWGTKLNANLDDIDAEIKLREDEAAAAQTTADDALPKAGGAMTGLVDVHSATLKRSALGTSGTQTMNLATAMYWTIAPSGTTTLAFSNVPATANAVVVVLLRITNGISQTINYPGSVAHAGGTAPTLSANKDTLMFISEDAGTSWRASVIQRNVA